MCRIWCWFSKCDRNVFKPKSTLISSCSIDSPNMQLTIDCKLIEWYNRSNDFKFRLNSKSFQCNNLDFFVIVYSYLNLLIEISIRWIDFCQNKSSLGAVLRILWKILVWLKKRVNLSYLFRCTNQRFQFQVNFCAKNG